MNNTKKNNTIKINFFNAMDIATNGKNPDNIFMISDKSKRAKCKVINVERTVDVLSDKTSKFYYTEDIKEMMEKASDEMFALYRKQTATIILPLKKLVELYKMNSIINPEYQRLEVKTKTEQSEIIALVITNHQSWGSFSIVRNPNKNIDEEGAWELWDGKQRLTTIIKFLANELIITGTNSILDGHNYESLCTAYPELKKNIDNILINIEITHKNYHHNIVTMFSNTNAKQTKMTKAEDMHARYCNNRLFSYVEENIVNNKAFNSIAQKTFARNSKNNRYGTSINVITAIAINEAIKNVDGKGFSIKPSDTCNAVADRFLNYVTSLNSDEVDEICLNASAIFGFMNKSITPDFCNGFNLNKDENDEIIRCDAGHVCFPKTYRPYLHSNRKSLLSGIITFAAFNVIRTFNNKDDVKEAVAKLDTYLATGVERHRTVGSKFINDTTNGLACIK